MQRTHLIEEPSALIGLARVCGGAGGQPPALVRLRRHMDREVQVLSGAELLVSK
jgi:hypothetical protein